MISQPINEKEFNTRETGVESDIIQFYDQYALNWDKRFGEAPSTRHFLNRRWQSFLEVLPPLGTISQAVELGVGTGCYIHLASKILPKIDAVDGSANMLKILTENLEKNNLRNVRPIQSNVLDLSSKISTSSVDLIYFFGLIEHIVDMKTFVSEIHRMLKSDGYVIGVTPNGNSPWYRLRRMVRGTGKHCSTDTYYTESNLDHIFGENGFTKEKVSHWGMVPAAIENKFIYQLLAILEPILEAIPILRRFLGGITFRYKKC